LSSLAVGRASPRRRASVHGGALTSRAPGPLWYFSRLQQPLGCGYLRRCVARQEVLQPHLPMRLPCYDFTPVMNLTVVSALLAVRLPTSGETHSHGVTGGVYKTRERIHRGMLIRDY